jgi:hypothetical protein
MKTQLSGWRSDCQAQQHITTKVKVKVKFALEQVIKAQRGSRGIAILFL